MDSRQGHQFQGRLYHAYSREEEWFNTMEQLLIRLEQFYDWMNFPYPGTDDHTFTGAGKERKRYVDPAERAKIMKDEELLSRHGELGTFVIRVQHRQNSSWQGRITWMEKDKTICFRSIWELIKLVDVALDTVCGQEDFPDEVRWTDI